mgnify:CR=1 FL=1
MFKYQKRLQYPINISKKDLIREIKKTTNTNEKGIIRTTDVASPYLICKAEGGRQQVSQGSRTRSQRHRDIPQGLRRTWQKQAGDLQCAEGIPRRQGGEVHPRSRRLCTPPLRLSRHTGRPDMRVAGVQAEIPQPGPLSLPLHAQRAHR